VAWWHYR